MYCMCFEVPVNIGDPLDAVVCVCVCVCVCVTQGRREGQALGAGAPPSSAKTTLRAPPSLMTVFSLGITGID